MPFSRRIVHFSPGPTDLKGTIADRAISGCWFELHRQGGCGPGELRLKDEFPDRHEIDVGDWIALEFDSGDRWYLGRVENRRADSPAGVTYRLEGMGVELGEVFPGGFSRSAADGIPPHRYAATDLFQNDPDHFDETVDAVSEPHELVTLLLQQYVVPQTHIALIPGRVESSVGETSVTSSKFRGEESARAIIKELALRARNAAWGVDENGEFFFLRPRTVPAATWKEGQHLISLEESRQRDALFNRVLLTGDYVYDEPISSGAADRAFYRWRGNYIQPASRDTHGERRIRLWVPWIRTKSDSREFAREFFRVYSQPTTRYLVEVGNQSTLTRPWDGPVRVDDRNSGEIITAQIETIRVQFDHAPRFRIEIGPEDPHVHWPEPLHDERWEIPGDVAPDFGGALITFASSSSGLSSSSAMESSSSNVSSSSLFSSSSGASSSSDESSSSSQPCIFLDHFTDTDGTNLQVHTPDIDSDPSETGWTERTGDTEIRSNKAEAIQVGTVVNTHRATCEATESDVEISAAGTLATPTGGDESSVGFLVRYFSTNDHWWLTVTRFNSGRVRILERNGGTNTARAEDSTVDPQAGDVVDMVATADGQTIRFQVSGDVSADIQYDSASFQETETLHGIVGQQKGVIGVGDSVKWDDFCIKTAQ